MGKKRRYGKVELKCKKGRKEGKRNRKAMKIKSANVGDRVQVAVYIEDIVGSIKFLRAWDRSLEEPDHLDADRCHSIITS